MLVKNMPLDDAQLYGRYKDLFPHILEVTNAKVQDMEINERALTQAQQIGNAFNELSQQMYQNSDSRERAVEKLAAQLDELNKSVAQSNLSSSDEVTFHLQQLEQTKLLFSSLNDDLAFIKYQLKHIIEARSDLLASLQKMAEPSHTEDVTSQTDIELF